MTLAREEKAKTKSTPNTSQNAEGFLLHNTLGLWVHQALQKHNSEQQLLLSPFSPKKKKKPNKTHTKRNGHFTCVENPNYSERRNPGETCPKVTRRKPANISSMLVKNIPRRS